MKRILLSCLILISLSASSQITYYYVGGAGPNSFTANSNWNTLLNGSGTTRVTADPTDILIFDGSNIGGSTPATGQVTVTMTSNTVGALKFTNNANVIFTRTGGSTGTISISGSALGDDFVIDAGSTLSLNSATANGSVQMVFLVSSTGRVAGALSEVGTGSQRITNSTAGITGQLVFASGGSFTANCTAATSSYSFGSNSQSSDRWVLFESGANLYYEGGWSPMGGTQAFSAIDFKPGSNWFHRANNAGFGSFFNTKGFGNITVENGATMFADGPIYRIGNFNITAGTSMTTHTSGQTAVLGNLTVNGSLSAPAGSTNVVIMAGTTPQTISGSGTITIPSLVIANGADVTLSKGIVVNTGTNVYGKLNFTNNQLSGAGTFNSRVNSGTASLTGNLVAGSYQITGIVGTIGGVNGLRVVGTGIPSNATVVGFSGTNATINLSQPITASGTGVTLNFTSDTATLATSHPNGFDSTLGSVTVTGLKTFQSLTNFIINGATSWPFGISSGSVATFIDAGFVEINAAATVNKSVNIYHHLTINNKLILRPLDLVHLQTAAFINGTFNSSKYIVTTYNSVTGDQSKVQVDALASSAVIPIGTPNYYLPVTLNPSATSDFTTAVFEGITSQGTITGTPLTAAQKQTVVNAVWTVSRLAGAGNVSMTLQWDPALEGSTFATLPGTDIGIITNTGSSWSTPVGSGNNTTNIVTGTVSSFGSFSAGAIPATSPFVFNSIPVKTYGNPDFNGGATSLNTTQPVVYSSSNLAVATIVGGNIHITGAGTTTITASQASDGFYPSASLSRTLTVNKAALTITADNKIKFEGDALPPLTFTPNGFVYGETIAVLLIPVTITTPATAASPVGTYSITVSGATAANYTITFVSGILTIQPKTNQTITFNVLAAKTYGNADFAAAATSTNVTIPITYVSSNTNVATIIGTNIHIVGAGTATITASQAGNTGYFAAPDVARLLTVNKAALTIKVRDTTKIEGQPNPPFTINYTGFVLGETNTNLLTQPVINTTATTTSPAGYYTLTPAGATSNNYAITFTAGRLTIYPPNGPDLPNMHVFMPDRSTLTVRVFVTAPALADIVLTDIKGRPLFKKNVFLPQGFMSFNLGVLGIPTGIYIVTVRGSGVDLKKMTAILR